VKKKKKKKSTDGAFVRNQIKVLVKCAMNISLAAIYGARDDLRPVTVKPAVDAMRSASAVEGSIAKSRLTS
jgi:hypothetical protein